MKKILLVLIAVLILVVSCKPSDLPPEPGPPGEQPSTDVVGQAGRVTTARYTRFLKEEVGFQYAPPFDVFETNKPVLINLAKDDFKVSNDGMNIEITASQQGGLVYKYGYVNILLNGIPTWRRYELSGTPVLKAEGTPSNWLSSSGTAALTFTKDEMTELFENGENYIVAYTCKKRGGRLGDWKCGCKDSSCQDPYWMLQSFLVCGEEQGIGYFEAAAKSACLDRCSINISDACPDGFECKPLAEGDETFCISSELEAPEIPAQTPAAESEPSPAILRFYGSIDGVSVNSGYNINIAEDATKKISLRWTVRDAEAIEIRYTDGTTKGHIPQEQLAGKIDVTDASSELMDIASSTTYTLFARRGEVVVSEKFGIIVNNQPLPSALTAPTPEFTSAPEIPAREVGECTDNTECDVEEFCQNRVCKPFYIAQQAAPETCNVNEDCPISRESEGHVGGCLVGKCLELNQDLVSTYTGFPHVYLFNCNTNSECGGIYSCLTKYPDTVGRVCHQTILCSSDDDCKDGTKCQDGRCEETEEQEPLVVACTSDDDCGANERCNVGIGRCGVVGGLGVGGLLGDLLKNEHIIKNGINFGNSVTVNAGETISLGWDNVGADYMEIVGTDGYHQPKEALQRYTRGSTEITQPVTVTTSTIYTILGRVRGSQRYEHKELKVTVSGIDLPPAVTEPTPEFMYDGCLFHSDCQRAGFYACLGEECVTEESYYTSLQSCQDAPCPHEVGVTCSDTVADKRCVGEFYDNEDECCTGNYPDIMYGCIAGRCVQISSCLILPDENLCAAEGKTCNADGVCV